VRHESGRRNIEDEDAGHEELGGGAGEGAGEGT
jgi:hypothetical protein